MGGGGRSPGFAKLDRPSSSLQNPTPTPAPGPPAVGFYLAFPGVGGGGVCFVCLEGVAVATSVRCCNVTKTLLGISHVIPVGYAAADDMQCSSKEGRFVG